MAAGHDRDSRDATRGPELRGPTSASRVRLVQRMHYLDAEILNDQRVVSRWRFEAKGGKPPPPWRSDCGST